MEAFIKNINALEDKTKVFIQKWKEIQEENQHLIERNKELEKENKKHSGLAVTENSNIGINNNADLSKIQETLNLYIERLDACIELLNIELNGK